MNQSRNNIKKHKSYLKSKKNHKRILKSIKNKKTVKIVFPVVHPSSWKADSIFKKMQQHPFFEPIIFICPYKFYGAEKMWEYLNLTTEFFKRKNMPMLSSYDDVKKNWIEIEQLSPDFIFFTNPHNITFSKYYDHLFSNFLTCYLPYHHEVGSGGDTDVQYNQIFHNNMWKIFATHEHSREYYRKYCAAKAKNVVVTGYPAMENIYHRSIKHNAWKTNDNRLKIIFAPHHTIINDVLSYSNFLKYADKFIDLAKEMKDSVVWSFKPHPILRSKLNVIESWGKDRTDQYYSFWQEQEFTQFNDDEYDDLFLGSDAMIHDSGSFLAEYLYLKKPVAYMMSEQNQMKMESGYSPGDYTKFGALALNACHLIKSFNEIKLFIENQVKNKELQPSHKEFLESEVNPYFLDEYPSDRIVNLIERHIKNSN